MKSKKERKEGRQENREECERDALMEGSEVEWGWGSRRREG